MATMNEGRHKAREFDSQLRTHFIRVHQGIVGVGIATQLPFVRTKEFPSNLLRTPKGITFRKAVCHTGSHLVIALERGVHFK